MPCAFRAGTSSASVVSTARVVTSVLAPYWLDRPMSTPGRPMISASPERGIAASATVATSPILTGAPAVSGNGARARSAAARLGAPAVMTMRWEGPSAKPPPRTAAAACTAAVTSASVTPRAAMASGRTCTSRRRSSPPKTMARATPGTASSRVRTCHWIRSRSFIGSMPGATKPIFNRSMVEEVSGLRRGVATVAGSVPAASAIASAST